MESLLANQAVMSADLIDPATPYALFQYDCVRFLDSLPTDVKFDLVVTSPPYNIGKEYENTRHLEEYVAWQSVVIDAVIPHLTSNASICWQVGNYLENGSIWPLDIEIAPIFKERGMKLRNRIVWRFGHGLHTKRRFSGRYEVILWFTNSNEYLFDLDAVRIPSKYPGKKHHKGPKAGQYSGNPLGKNPEDVWEFDEHIWEIPNVKSNHPEKTEHPCQFPVGLVERLILALTKPGQWVFDPFAGVASTGVAAALHNRRFWGCDLEPKYLLAGVDRINEALNGTARYRPHDQPIYDHKQSKLAENPFTPTDNK